MPAALNFWRTFSPSTETTFRILTEVMFRTANWSFEQRINILTITYVLTLKIEATPAVMNYPVCTVVLLYAPPRTLVSFTSDKVVERISIRTSTRSTIQPTWNVFTCKRTLQRSKIFLCHFIHPPAYVFQHTEDNNRL